MAWGTGLKIVPVKLKYSTKLFISYFILLTVVVVALTIGSVSSIKRYIDTSTLQQLSMLSQGADATKGVQDLAGALIQSLIYMACGVFVLALCFVVWMARKIALPLKQLDPIGLEGVSLEKKKREMILDNMINGIVVTDNMGNIELMNQAAYALFFYTHPSSQKVNLMAHAEIYKFAQQVLASEEVDPMEIKHPNGQYIMVVGSVYTEAENSQEKCILIAQDITKVNRLERTRQDFVANVSHELKTPITFIRSILETILVSKEKGLEVGPEFLEKGMRHIDRLNQIIDDLLQLSTLETTGKELERSEARLHQILERAVGLCEPLANKKGMVLQIEGKDVALQCNAALIEQGVRNLVENAIKYAPEKTMVTMGGDIKNNMVTLFVKDEGPGIEKKYIKRLFQRFYRIDDARSRELGGTGLGLAIVKHIAQAHQGRAWVDSSVAQGSCFNMEIPLS